MPFIGNKPADSYTSFAKQDFTTSATTSYTLDYPVANANEIALFINFVRQEPTTAYTATGTSLTLTSATSATDDMYCVFLGKALQTVNPPAGSVGLSQLSATGTASASTYLRGDNSWGAISVGDNTPAFRAEASGNTSLANASWTKVNVASEIYDTDTNFDTSTSRFTPTTAGKYNFSLNCQMQNGGTFNLFQVALYKNGSQVSSAKTSHFYSSGDSQYRTQNLVLTCEANGSTDYFEMYAYQDAGGAINALSGASTYFEAHKLNGV